MRARVILLLVCCLIAAAPTTRPSVLESTASTYDLPLTTDPNGDVWANAPRVLAERDRMGAPVPGPPTEVRSRWTREHLFLLFICPYTHLSLKDDPTLSKETDLLWHWDVAEAFIGSDFEHIFRYREFQVSPRGEWADLNIDRSNPQGQEGLRWDSGFSVSARIDAESRTWYAVMRIPFRALDARPPQPGREFRLGLYRITGHDEPRTRYVWQPTGQATFHVPEAFGILRLR
jgi:hypothetical protein